MNLSGPFIRRPVATMLLSLAIMLLGGVSFGLLPVSPLPQMDFPVIVVQASLPGASPEVMASTVATPLERKLGRLPASPPDQQLQPGLDPGDHRLRPGP
jgi:multidrug efflux pump